MARPVTPLRRGFVRFREMLRQGLSQYQRRLCAAGRWCKESGGNRSHTPDSLDIPSNRTAATCLQ
jgi:hypothetical protein